MTTIERRREQNRLAQRRYRQRQQQSAAAASLYARLATDPVRIVPTPSHSAPTAAAAAAAIALPVGQPSQPQSEPSAYTFSYASPAVGKSKSFCDLITDGANLLLDGLGTIDMGDVELPSAFLAAHQPGSSRPSPTPAEVVEALSRSRVYARTPSSSSFATPADSVDPTHSGENARFADVDAETSADKEKGRRGKRWATPLHMAAGKGQDKIVRTLLQHNADCNQRDGDGFTPLMRAAAAGYRETCHAAAQLGRKTVKERQKDASPAPPPRLVIIGLASPRSSPSLFHFPCVIYTQIVGHSVISINSLFSPTRLGSPLVAMMGFYACRISRLVPVATHHYTLCGRAKFCCSRGFGGTYSTSTSP
ncbi:hypothetical protein F5Y14DRAFT_92862 [Nemania sp. NC0429]|nr:hypothetical protein F5Y14DRAFT_92862 [Nemania sp. NC0429]